MIRFLLVIAGAAGTAIMAGLWAFELRRSEAREEILWDQIGRLEEALRIPISQRISRDLLDG